MPGQPQAQAPVGAPDAGTAAGAAADAPPVEEPPNLALRLEVSGVPGVKLELQVLSAAEAPLFTVKGGDGEPLSLRNVGVRSQDRFVYLVVRSAWSGTGKDAKRGANTEAAYTLGVSLEEAGATAEMEPNDTRDRATPLPVAGYREGFLSPKGDVDHYVLRPTTPSLVRAQLSGVERVDFVLSLVRPATDGGTDTVALRANDGAVKEPEQLNNVYCAGECVLRVEGGTRKLDGQTVRDFENAETPYRLTVSTTPDTGAEEREPNGTVTDATPLTLGKPIRGTVFPKKDSDYYLLDLSGRSVKTPLRATLTGVLKVDVGLYLHRVEEDGLLELVQTADRGKGDATETIRYSADPATYVLEVRESRGRAEANFQDAYQLTVEEQE